MSGLGTTIESGGIVGATSQPIPQDVQTIPSNPGEIVHTSSVESLKFLLSEDFIFTDRFTISVDMQPGAVFGLIRIHPLDAHMYIRHVYQMFNAWNGTVGIRSRFMGTAFYGGSFRVGFLPPNISVDQVRSMSVAALTAYPNVDLDPKNTNWMYYSPPDERNVMYHWAAEPDSAKPETFGGYIVFYVVGPLVTQNDQFRSISMIVEMQGKYTFAQPNPNFGPGFTPDTPGPLDEFALRNLTSQLGCDDGTNSMMKLQVHNNAVVNLPNGGLFAYGFNGKNPSAFQNNEMAEVLVRYRANVETMAKDKVLPLLNTTCTIIKGATPDSKMTINLMNMPPIALNAEKAHYILDSTLYGLVEATGVPTRYMQSNGFNIGYLSEAIKITMEMKNLNAGVLPNNVHQDTPTTLMIRPEFIASTPINPAETAFDGVNNMKFTPLPASESIVSFVNVNTRTINLQTFNMKQNLKKSSGLDEGTSFLYMLRARGVPTPLRLLRLSANGMWTTTAVAADALLDADTELYLTYEGELPYTSPLPPQSADMYHAERHLRKMAKTSIR